MNDTSRYKLIKIFTNEGDTYHGHPLHEAIINYFSSHKFHCHCTVSRCIAGYNEKGEIYDRKILTLSTKMPLIIHIITPESELQKIQQELTMIVNNSYMTIEDIKVLKAP